ncbi:acetoacetate decarboxylase family protein [Haloarcula onubensis]|uniref:Acetoacetate decarboxylase family protein n=1 Tax=Haloarcula onubensis TaxID=2950539 RepID=A0ABU2FPZ3_9EURY|nr:acetoacetate decarboxylase family protein [Halomicroarcula sp. S3CR25-11]MDS0282830.1 acetoacetate decarboxylase family protein [Halomicroarcula sp. S3CR25-11]
MGSETDTRDRQSSADRGSATAASEARDLVTLSTGHEIRLPLETAATVTGLLLPADSDAVVDLLPAGLQPVRVTPRRAVVTLLAVEYHRIGDDAVGPYDEFAVVLAATPERARPLVPLATGEYGGYVHSLPVTTDPARALGAEVWGFPKSVARISHHDEGRRRTTSVVEDGDHVLTVDIARPRTWPATRETTSYAVRDGRLEALSTHMDGRFGVRPLSSDFEVMVGYHDRSATLRDLDIGDRALAQVAFEGTVTYGAGGPVA